MSTVTANFTPVRRLISNVSTSAKSEVTTTEEHGFIDGQWVRIIVPVAYGMEIDYVATPITVLSATEFQTLIDTRGQLPFSTPSAPPAFTEAQVVPITGVTDNLGII